MQAHSRPRAKDHRQHAQLLFVDTGTQAKYLTYSPIHGAEICRIKTYQLDSPPLMPVESNASPFPAALARDAVCRIGHADLSAGL